MASPATGSNMTFSFLPSSPCQTSEFYFHLTLVIDGKGSEVSWALKETYTGNIALSGNGYGNHEEVRADKCLPTTSCYTFVINDIGTDGICCKFGAGGYIVRMNGLKVAIGNEFRSTNEHNLPCIRPPTTPSTSSPTTLAPVTVCGCE